MDGRHTEKQSDAKKPNSLFQQNQARIRALFLGQTTQALAAEESPESIKPVEVIQVEQLPLPIAAEKSVAVNIASEENIAPPPELLVEQPLVIQPSITIENTDTTKPSDEFQQNQAMVDKLLLEQQFQVKMRNIIREFFAVQRTFHDAIDKFVRAFDGVFESLSLQQQESLQILLQPYCMLVANPFNDYPSGDIEEDLKHIVSVINKRNAHFVKILPAISLAVMKVDEFSKFLSEIKTDPKLKVAMLQGIQSASWMDVESRVMLPNQRVMQYRLLLTTIETTIMKAMEEDMAKFGKTNKETYLSLLSPAIVYILPKLQYVNNNDHSKVSLLDDIDLLFNDMLKMENMKQHADFMDKVKKTKRLLDTIIQKINFNYGSQLDHLRELWEALQDIKVISETTLQEEEKRRAEQYDYEGKQSYLKQGFYLAARAYSVTFYGGVYYPPGQDPREKFLDLMGKLQVEIRNLEYALLAFSAFDLLSEKVGGRSPLMRKL